MRKIITNKGLNWNSTNKEYYGLKAECDQKVFYGINKLSKISGSYHNIQRGLEYFSTEKIRYYGILSGLEARTKYKNFIANLRLIRKLNQVMPHIFK